MASVRFHCVLNLFRLPISDLGRGELEEDDLPVTVKFRCWKFDDSTAATLTALGYNQCDVYLGEVVTEEEGLVLEVARPLTELGIPEVWQVRMIAELMDYVEKEVICRWCCQPAMVYMDIVEATGDIDEGGIEESLLLSVTDHTGISESLLAVESVSRRSITMDIREHQQLWASITEGDSDTAYAVRRLRESWRSVVGVRSPLQRRAAAEVAERDLEVGVRQSMEVDNVNVVAASWTAINSILVKVQQGGDEVLSCVICMENEEDEMSGFARMLPCKHVFHTKCAATWLRISPSCPLCRYPMPL